jgi:hypothetical protein
MRRPYSDRRTCFKDNLEYVISISIFPNFFNSELSFPPRSREGGGHASPLCCQPCLLLMSSRELIHSCLELLAVISHRQNPSEFTQLPIMTVK